MKKGLFIIIFIVFVFSSCKHNNQAEENINKFNQEAFEMRYNMRSAMEKTEKALELIENSHPSYMQGKAVAWNNLGLIYLLQNKYDSAKIYVDCVKGITVDYPNKELEEDIASITLANIYRHKRDLDSEIQVYFEQLNLFQIRKNGVEVQTSFNFDNNDSLTSERYYFAQSFLYFGLLYISQCNEDKCSILENFYDENKFPPSSLDTCQMNDLLYRRAYNNYIQSKNKSFEIPTRSSFLNKCFIDLAEWLNWLSPQKDIQHIANFYEFFSRIINDEESKTLMSPYSEETTFNIIKNDLLKRINYIGSTNIDSISVSLLKEAYLLSEQYDFDFDRAWYGLQLGNYFYEHKDIIESDKWYQIYSEIEIKKLNDNSGQSWRIYKKDNKGYQLFLQKQALNDPLYLKLQKIFEKEETEEFHDDEVLLNQIIRLQSLLREEKSLHDDTKKYLLALIILSIILLLSLINALSIVFKKGKIISNFLKCKTTEELKNAVNKCREREKNQLKNTLKYIRKIVRISLILISTVVLCFLFLLLGNLEGEIIGIIGVFSTIIFGIVSILYPKLSEKFKNRKTKEE
jgi:ribosomal protein L31